MCYLRETRPDALTVVVGNSISGYRAQFVNKTYEGIDLSEFSAVFEIDEATYAGRLIKA